MAPRKTQAPKNAAILTEINALQTILAHNVGANLNSRKKVFVKADDPQDLPQTLITYNDENEDIHITELMQDKSKRAFYFLDSHKTQNKCWANMIDVTLNGCLPPTTRKPCWWCRNSFSGMPIGCPIFYYPQKTSGVEKERFEEKLLAANLPTDTNNFFETEGYFCSFPCCKAYILDQKSGVRYKESLALLSLLFFILTDGQHADFPTAPTWKVLKDYGGHLTIKEFRSTFGKLEYRETVNSRRPYMYCSSQYLLEKRVKLFRGIKE